MKNSSKFLNHICKNNIEQNSYVGGFEFSFSLSYRCPKCMTLEIKPEDCKMICNKNIFKISNKVIVENYIGKINDII